MRVFNVLSPSLDLSHSYFLEASAGTGKTFAIENLLARLLIEEAVPLERCLIVTFTEAATEDLRDRIRQQLLRLIAHLEQGESGIYAYLQPILDGGIEQIQVAILSLKRALMHFSQSFICTIHSFCARMLTEFAFLIPGGGFQKHLVTSRDFLREQLLQLDPELFSPGQWARLSSRGVHALVDELFPLTQSRLPVAPLENWRSSHECYQNGLKALYAFPFLESFLAYAPFLSGGCNRSGTLKEVWVRQAEELARQIEEGCSLASFDRMLLSEPEFLSVVQGKPLQKAPPPPEHWLQLVQTLQPLWRARCRRRLLASLAGHCLRKKREERSCNDPDLLLHRIDLALEKGLFRHAVEERFELAIIDEFQDTDPLQWKIFWRCFEKKRLFLVGDPKQSIYAFRQADLYTYLNAGQALSKANFACLFTNFRSQPKLIEAFNHLFAVDWMPLPKAGKFLPVRSVQAAPEKLSRLPDLPALTFMVGQEPKNRSERWPTTKMETEMLFPFIANEMIALRQRGLCWSDFACLVSDRFQKERLALFLEAHQIPYHATRERSLAETAAFTTLKVLAFAASSPKESHLQLALTSPLLLPGGSKESLLECFALWRREGLFPFAQKISQESFFDRSLLQSFWHCITLLYRHCQVGRFIPPETVYIQLCQWERINLRDCPDLQIEQKKGGDGVEILTLHSSKGLEFPVVFALALASRTTKEELLIPNREGTSLQLPEESPEAHALFLEEKDAEKMRQLYVALTRAKEKAYLALVLDDPWTPPPPGEGSAAELFLKKQIGQGSVESFFTSLPSCIEVKMLEKQETPVQQSPLTQESVAGVAFLPPLPPLTQERVLLHQDAQQKMLLRALHRFGLDRLQAIASEEAMTALAGPVGSLLWYLLRKLPLKGGLFLYQLPPNKVSRQWSFLTHCEGIWVEGTIDLLINLEGGPIGLFLGKNSAPLLKKAWQSLLGDGTFFRLQDTGY